MEMATALDAKVKIIGVKEAEEKSGKAPDFKEEKRRCTAAVSDCADYVVGLLDSICFIPYRRQKHEVKGMLDEIERQAFSPAI